MKETDLSSHGEAGEALKTVISSLYESLKNNLQQHGSYLFYLNFVFIPNDKDTSNLNVTIYTRPEIEDEPDTEEYKTKLSNYLVLLAQRLGDDPFVINSVLSSLLDRNEETLDSHVDKLERFEANSSTDYN